MFSGMKTLLVVLAFAVFEPLLHAGPITQKPLDEY